MTLLSWFSRFLSRRSHHFRLGKLKGRFHPDFPDDVQVIVHEGGPYFSDRAPELIWVRVTGCERDIFSGIVLNTPHQLREVRQGSVITFIVPEKGEYPLLVSAKYVQERPTWRLLTPCENCGLSELFDPPSDLIAKSFSSDELEQVSRVLTFTTRCGFCRGTVMVRIKRTGLFMRLARNARLDHWLADHPHQDRSRFGP